jgi:hypothetical protein
VKSIQIHAATQLADFCQKNTGLTYLYKQWVANQLNFADYSKDQQTLFELSDDDLMTFLVLASPDQTVSGFIKQHVSLDQLREYQEHVQRMSLTSLPPLSLAIGLSWVVKLTYRVNIGQALTDYILSVYDTSDASEIDQYLAKFCVQWHQYPASLTASLHPDLLDTLLTNLQVRLDVALVTQLTRHIPATTEYAKARQRLPQLLSFLDQEALLEAMPDTNLNVVRAIVSQGAQFYRFMDLADQQALDVLTYTLTDSTCRDALRIHPNPKVRALVALASARVNDSDLCEQLVTDPSPLVLQSLLVGGCCHQQLTSNQNDDVQETVAMLKARYKTSWTHMAPQMASQSIQFWLTSEYDIRQFAKTHLGVTLPIKSVLWL